MYLSSAACRLMLIIGWLLSNSLYNAMQSVCLLLASYAIASQIWIWKKIHTESQRWLQNFSHRFSHSTHSKELFGIQPEMRMRKVQKSQLQRYYLTTKERWRSYDSECSLQEFNWASIHSFPVRPLPQFKHLLRRLPPFRLLLRYLQSSRNKMILSHSVVQTAKITTT